MALTREFKNTVAARVQRDPRFREALFTEALNAAANAIPRRALNERRIPSSTTALIPCPSRNSIVS